MFESKHIMKIKPHEFCDTCHRADYKKKRTKIDKNGITKIYECKYKDVCIIAVECWIGYKWKRDNGMLNGSDEVGCKI